MKIYWGFRLAADASFFWLLYQYFSAYPVLYWRHSKMEPVRWTQRRRAFFENQYFSKPEEWKLKYNERFEVIGA